MTPATYLSSRCFCASCSYVRICYVICVASIALFGTPGSMLGDEPRSDKPTIEDILSGLARRYDNLHHLTMHVTAEEEIVNGRRPLPTEPGETDRVKYFGDKILATSKMSATYRIDGDKRAFTLIYPRGTPASESNDAETHKMTWNGSVQMRLTTNSDLKDGFIDGALSNHVLRNYLFRHLDYPVSKFSFREKGHFYLPDSIDDSRAEVLSETETIDGRRCHVVSVKGRDRLWIDVPRGFALVKREIRDADRNIMLQKTYNSEWQKVNPDVWFPGRSVREYYCGDERPKELWNTVSTRVTLHSTFRNEKIPAEAFTIEFPAGTYVTDVAHGDTYRIPEAGVNPLDSAVKQALGQQELPPDFLARRRNNWRLWVIIVNVNALLLISLMIGIRKLRRRSAETTDK